MKLLKLLLPLIVTVSFFWGCSSETSPSSVAESFLTALAKGDVKSAKAYASEDTVKLLDMASAFGAIPKRDDFSFELIHEEIKGDRALVTFKNQKGKEQKIRLKKVDGQWKVNEAKK